MNIFCVLSINFLFLCVTANVLAVNIPWGFKDVNVKVICNVCNN